MQRLRVLGQTLGALRTCERCPDMIGPVVTGTPILSPVFLLGQAPGPHEGKFGKPFAWTAGKTMFGWFQTIGVDETTFRAEVYMAAVCRCFPGKNAGGGDRVPSATEIGNCSGWLAKEVSLVRPALFIPVGKLAIAQMMPIDKLDQVIGKQTRVTWHGHQADCIPLPHPSGASTWHRTEPGRSLLGDALRLIAAHPSWKPIRDAVPPLARAEVSEAHR